jgi:carbamoyl-phosphate synthase / aspartate carbamoyltransferase / dihydroorotase
MYLDQTYGPLRLDDMTLWMEHFERWPRELAGGGACRRPQHRRCDPAGIAVDRPVHIAHVALREEILLIRAAKEKGLKVTCEVGPHHLFLSSADFERLPGGRKRSAPAPGRARRPAGPVGQPGCDRLLCHRPCPAHPGRKRRPNPPPGFPGLETALPLLLTAVHQGRLTPG